MMDIVRRGSKKATVNGGSTVLPIPFETDHRSI